MHTEQTRPGSTPATPDNGALRGGGGAAGAMDRHAARLRQEQGQTGPSTEPPQTLSARLRARFSTSNTIDTSHLADGGNSADANSSGESPSHRTNHSQSEVDEVVHIPTSGASPKQNGTIFGKIISAANKFGPPIVTAVLEPQVTGRISEEDRAVRTVANVVGAVIGTSVVDKSIPDDKSNLQPFWQREYGATIGIILSEIANRAMTTGQLDYIALGLTAALGADEAYGKFVLEKRELNKENTVPARIAQSTIAFGVMLGMGTLAAVRFSQDAGGEATMLPLAGWLNFKNTLRNLPDPEEIFMHYMQERLDQLSNNSHNKRVKTEGPDHKNRMKAIRANVDAARGRKSNAPGDVVLTRAQVTHAENYMMYSFFIQADEHVNGTNGKNSKAATTVEELRDRLQEVSMSEAGKVKLPENTFTKKQKQDAKGHLPQTYGELLRYVYLDVLNSTTVKLASSLGTWSRGEKTAMKQFAERAQWSARSMRTAGRLEIGPGHTRGVIAERHDDEPHLTGPTVSTDPEQLATAHRDIVKAAEAAVGEGNGHRGNGHNGNGHTGGESSSFTPVEIEDPDGPTALIGATDDELDIDDPKDQKVVEEGATSEDSETETELIQDSEGEGQNEEDDTNDDETPGIDPDLEGPPSGPRRPIFRPRGPSGRPLIGRRFGSR